MAFAVTAPSCAPIGRAAEPALDDGTTGPLDEASTDATSTPPLDDGSTTLPGRSTGVEDSTSDVGGSEGFDFIRDPDGGGHKSECDLFLEDCPPAEKCMPWANDGGGAWNATRCSPVARDAAGVGEPCTVEGNAVSGIDDCELHSMCWDVDLSTNAGTCIAFCIGDSSNPYCEDPTSFCSIGGSGVLALCLPTCNPIAQDCQRGQACYPNQWVFTCLPDVSGTDGQAGDACEFINVCDPGTMCADASSFETCEGVGCCSSFCSLQDAKPPCLSGQACQPWYRDGEAPPGLEALGVCAIE